MTPVQMKDRPHRSGAERVVMLAPELFCRLAAPVFRLPPRLRRRAVAMALDRSFAANNRGDEEFAARLFYWPDAVLLFDGDYGPDFLPRYEGRDAVFAAYARWQQEWGVLRRFPVGFVDRGDRIVVLTRELMRGQSSGLEVDREVGQVFVLRDGRVAKQTEYRSWEDALALA